MDPATLPALPGLLSTDRFGTYLAASDGEVARAVRLYSWNIEVSAALWGPFHILEITLRNAFMIAWPTGPVCRTGGAVTASRCAATILSGCARPWP